MPGAARRILAQLGYGYPYGDDGVPAPPAQGPGLLGMLEWEAGFEPGGRVATAEPLFPRIDTESPAAAEG